MSTEYTKNFNLPLPEFDEPRWQDFWRDAMSIIDALLAKYITSKQVTGVWQNSTAYTVGQVAVDDATGQLFECIQAHTSAAVPTTFAQARTANANLWKDISLSERNRGTWTAGTAYGVGDFVVSGNIYAVCKTAHTSSTIFASDSALWDYLIDFTANDVIKDYTAAGSPLTLLWADGTHARITVTSASASALTFTPRTLAVGRTQTFRVTVIQTSTGTLTWPAGIRWPGSAAPTYDTNSGTRAEYIFTTSDNGATYDGFLVGVRMG